MSYFTDVGFTLYGFIPIVVPQRVLDNYGNLTTAYRFEEGVDYVISPTEDHTIVVEGWLVGRLKRMWKKALISLRQVQAGVEAGVTLKDRQISSLPLPFVTDMSFELDMVIKDLQFIHDWEIKDSYRFRMTLRQVTEIEDWKKTLRDEAIKAGISAIATTVNAKSMVSQPIDQLGYFSFKSSSRDRTIDQDGCWSVGLLPPVDPTPRATNVEVTIPDGLELEDYEMASNLAIGFDTSKTWYKLPMKENDAFPQRWKLKSSNGESYEIQLQIVPLPDEKYLEVKITRSSDGTVLFNQRVSVGVCYKIDKGTTTIESTVWDESENEEVVQKVDQSYYKIWFGFITLELKKTLSNPLGELSIVEGVVYFNNSG